MRIFIMIVLSILMFLPSEGLRAKEKSTAIPLDEMDKAQAKEKVSRTLGELARAMTDLASLRERQCVRAIGNQEMCGCIAYASPSGIDFTEYIALVSHTKDELNYENLSLADRQLVDGAQKARDECLIN